MIYSKDIRHKVIDFVAKGGSKSDAARKFDISLRTVFYWFSRENIEPTKVLTRNRKINKSLLEQYVRSSPDATLRERSEIFGVSVNAIWKALKGLKIRKKNDEVY